MIRTPIGKVNRKSYCFSRSRWIGCFQHCFAVTCDAMSCGEACCRDMHCDALAFMTKTMADILREAIRKSGQSAGQLAELTGVSQPTITEFLRGKDMRLDTAQKLAEFLGLTLQER